MPLFVMNMIAVVRANDSPLYFCSPLVVGTNKEYNNTSGELTSTTNTTTPPTLPEPQPTDAVDKVPPNYFFKGFLAWCLWGHLPIVGGEAMKSSLFTEAKTPTSFGRKTSSRRTIKANSNSKGAGSKEVTTSLSVSSSRSAKKRRIQEESTTSGMSLADETNKDEETFMEQTVQFFHSEFLEKELQKRNYLEIRMLKDEIASTTRRCDRLTDRYYRMKKGPEAEEVKISIDEYEAEILELESKLKALQEAEVKRRDEMLDVMKHHFDDDEEMENKMGMSILLGNQEAYQAEISELQSKVKRLEHEQGNVQNDSTATGPAVCVECSVNPTSHRCRKCKRYICAICCRENRDLEMIWWCEDCFEAESVTNQRQIRDGKYESDGEETFARF